MIRSKIEEGKIWFPIIDITKYCQDGKSLHKAAVSWLKNNLEESGIKKIYVEGSINQKAGKVLCVDSDNIRIVGMYESHLFSGKNFRAKWSELPDSPCFPSETKKELSWKNLYKWSKAEHLKNCGVNDKTIQYLRVVAREVENKTGMKNPEEMITFNQALVELNIK